MPHKCSICNMFVGGEKPFLILVRGNELYMFHEKCLGPMRIVPDPELASREYYVKDDSMWNKFMLERWSGPASGRKIFLVK